MGKKENIVRYSADEVAAMIARGESRTDWERVRAMSQEEVERLADEEEGPLPEGWESRSSSVYRRASATCISGSTPTSSTGFARTAKVIRRGSTRCSALS